jgi:hypothetical protein
VQATPGLRAYFRFSETGGAVVSDRIEGRRLDVDVGVALDEGTVPFDDPEPSSVRFFGGQPDHISGRYDSDLQFKRAMTVELWVRPHGNEAEDGRCLQVGDGWTKLVWVDGVEPGFFGAWGLHLHGNDSTALAFHMQIDPVGDGLELQEAAAVTASGALETADDPGCADGSWQHLVATYDAASDPNVSVYVDGVPAPGEGFIAPTGTAGGLGGYAPDARLHVGGLGLQPEVPYDYPVTQGLTFDGWIDELALYDRALSPWEVLEHYETYQDD